MKYWTRRNRSQRASAIQKVTVLETVPDSSGATHYPILYFQVDGVWHCIEFENEGEAKVLMSSAAQIFRGIK